MPSKRWLANVESVTMDLIFLAVLSLYLVVGIKVDEWITISLLGFKSHTPPLFLTNPRLYDWVRGGLFAAAAACLFRVTFAWYLGVGALYAAWMLTTWGGQHLAFKTFRTIMREVLDRADTDSDRQSALEYLNKTDAELRDMAMKANKLGW